MMLVFLSAEFLFYLWGIIGTIVRGPGLFFQINNPDLLLRIVYSIGYMNFFASGYFLFHLLRHRDFFQTQANKQQNTS